MHGARHVAAADRSVGTARTRRETDDHPLRAAGAEAAGPKPKREAIPLSDSYGTGQSRAPRRRPRAGPRRRVYPYVYNMLIAVPPPRPDRVNDRRSMADLRFWRIPRPRATTVGDGKLTRNLTGTSAFQCAPGFEYFFDVDRPVVTGSPPAQESLSRLARGQGHRRGETPTPVSAPLLVAFSLVSRRKCPVLYAFSIEAPPGSSGPGARWRQRGSGGGGRASDRPLGATW